MIRHLSTELYTVDKYLLLLLLSRFSCVRLCETPEMAAHQAPPSLGFSGKNTGVGCHFLLQCMKVKREREVAQSCPTLSDPVYCSPPGSSIHGIFQAKVLEWGAIAFFARVPRDWNRTYPFHQKPGPEGPTKNDFSFSEVLEEWCFRTFFWNRTIPFKSSFWEIQERAKCQ